MTRMWRQCSLLGLMAAALATSSRTEAGIIPWPWNRNSEPVMTERRCEREAYYAERACDPIGAKQVYKKGKQWPPFPRPQGPANLPSHLYHAEHYWPHPYNCQDREYVHALSNAHVNNGWVTMTTLYDYHFEPDTHQLNTSGRTHIRWILENAPSKNRYIFVQATFDDATTAVRQSATKVEAVSLCGIQPVPPVLVRVTSPLGRPAQEIDAIRRKELETIEKPRITSPIGSNNFGAAEASGN